MSNLLRVMNRRLIKDRFLWIALAATILLSLYNVFLDAPNFAREAAAGGDEALEDFYYNFTPLLGVVCAAFTSLFLGTENADGTIRNKLIAGYSRGSVYGAMLLATAAGCLVLLAGTLAAGFVGLLYFEGFAAGTEQWLGSALILSCSLLVFAATYTALSMLISNRAVAAVAAMLLWLVLLFGGSAVVNLLAAPEMTCDYFLEGANWVAGEPYPNPNYVSGIKRGILEFLQAINPVCTAIRIAENENPVPMVQAVYSLITAAVISVTGCAVFRKKDMK